jgi:hypothetical protein
MTLIDESDHSLGILGPPAVQREIRRARQDFLEKLGILAPSMTHAR